MQFNFQQILLFILTAVTLIFAQAPFECSTREIRSYRQLDSLTNCTAILGNLALLFPVFYDNIDYTPEEINNRSFPIREVTGFFLVYAVNHLDSLGGMFPNLTVIRGTRLFSNYAFVIHESDIKEIALRNLLKIKRGAARIDKTNPRLCFPNIDWSQIIESGKMVASQGSYGSMCEFNRCHSCEHHNLCWNNKMCQRFEKTFKSPKMKPCHHLCLGHCTNRTASGCYVCKDLSEDGVCVNKCSENKVLNIDTRRCLDKSKCVALNRYIFNNECLESCPPGFTAALNQNDTLSTTNVCIKCIDKCPKICSPPEIRRISQLEELGVGCTIVNGTLEIYIIDDVFNLTEEFNKYLGDIEEIHGVIKIHRSSAITELTFLNNLRVIYGYKKKPAMLIFENPNLQKLFDWEKRGGMKLRIRRGEVHIYSNLMLCANETRKLVANIERPNGAPETNNLIQNNGIRNICKAPTILTRAVVLSHESCKIQWKNTKPTEVKGNFQAYIIQYAATKPNEKFDGRLFFERETCSSFGWHSIYLNHNEWEELPDGFLEFVVTDLDQSTRYAYMVQTYVYGPNEVEHHAASQSTVEDDGAISEVGNFETLMRVPTRPKSLKIVAKTPTSLSLGWDILANEADDIRYQYLDVVMKPFNLDFVVKKDYCMVREVPKNTSESVLNSWEGETMRTKNEFCKMCCVIEEEDKKKRQKKENDFEEALIKFSETTSRESHEPRNAVQSVPGYVGRFFIESDKRTFIIEKLRAYTIYQMFLHACSSERVCSEYALAAEITATGDNKTYDRIKIKFVKPYFDSEDFEVYFNEPVKVNGAIITYISEFREMDGNKTNYLFSECITREKHEENNHRYALGHSLISGTYTFRIMAVSLAGKGLFTEFFPFEVYNPYDSLSKGWYILLSVVIVFAVTIGTVWYYKRKGRFVYAGRSDTEGLLHAIEMHEMHNVASSLSESVVSTNLI
ncbi:CLUMA_CG019541, isoform A [Clunio marinus]|uniref:receptor protein-tyrosine kinase n=1 Tax=Clunio marinus TaxID=568069 RepID=A0A1J1J3A1_9DIPT|nr:CLUMA_CG019541, isoform A [Clunio marinus]